MTIAVYLLLLAIAVGWLSNRVRVPYPILLVLAGIAIGFLPQARTIFVEPALLLAVVLPAALYPAAIDTSWRDFRRNLRPIEHAGDIADLLFAQSEEGAPSRLYFQDEVPGESNAGQPVAAKPAAASPEKGSRQPKTN
jgi:hypothetical protein